MKALVACILVCFLSVSGSLSAEEPFLPAFDHEVQLVDPTWDDLADALEALGQTDFATRLRLLSSSDILEFVVNVPRASLPGQSAELRAADLAADIFFDCPKGCVFRPGEVEGEPDLKFRFADISGRVRFWGATFDGWDGDSPGAVIKLTGDGRLQLDDSVFRLGSSTTHAGAISTNDNSCLRVNNTVFYGNIAVGFSSDIDGNSTGQPGCDPIDIRGSSFYGAGQINSIDLPVGRARLYSNTFGYPDSTINNTAEVTSQGTVFFAPMQANQAQSANESQDKPEAICNDFGIGTFNSMGYNAAADNSCGLDQETDIVSAEMGLDLTEDEVFVPQPDSAVVDSGADAALVPADDGLAFLPCGYKDLLGTARPQDANGDGEFECDRGAVELQGQGEVLPQHSAVFYNPERNGEGNYVEILESGVAVVYTFTYNPAGDGPAWFIGAGEYRDNQIVMDELLRPAGARFGDGFDPADIDFTPAGSMSMVFSDCASSTPGGSIAYTGEEGLGFEGLLTRATRLSTILGCSDEVPSPNAGLSGSWYDPARNGEGLIIEWLSGDQVLAVFFTYDPDGNQFWVVGQGTADGNSVTMDALYPVAFTPWGRNFNADDITLESWGTFTLNWTDCNSMTFEYTSSVEGFGTATRNYSRLTTLAGTACPGN